MDIVTWGIQAIKDIIDAIGYEGIFILMSLESMLLPIPSEIILPFAGWLAEEGRMDPFAVMISGTIGCAFGSSIAFFLGRRYGEGLFLRFGKYVFLSESHLRRVEDWFDRRGDVMVLVTRLVPVFRTFISIPAGMSRMTFGRFLLLTTIGSGIWCAILTYLGFVLGPGWEEVDEMFKELDIVVLVVIAAILLYLGIRWYRRRAHEE